MSYNYVNPEWMDVCNVLAGASKNVISQRIVNTINAYLSRNPPEQ